MPEGAQTHDDDQSTGPESQSGLEYFNRLPWERIVTWGFVFLVLYVLRDFFFVIFATFLICYFARRFSALILYRIPKQHRTVGIQRATAVGIFVAYLLLFVGLMLAIFPELFRQGRAILERVEATNIQAESTKVLDRTVGSFLFHRQFGDASQPKWQASQDAYRSSDDLGRGWWQAWPALRSSIQSEQMKTPRRTFPLQRGDKSTASEEAAFQQYADRAHDVELDYATYVKWNSAFTKGEQAFLDQVRRTIDSAPELKKNELTANDFELFTRSQMAQDWLTNDPIAGSIRHYIDKHKPEFLNDLGEWTQRILRNAFAFPFQLGMAFLIAFLICFDAPNILSRIRSIRDTRIRHYYDEIAPMMSNFGSLTGKAIESQLVIGVINTILSIAVLMLLGVENIYFLASVILVASIVPVIGSVMAVTIVCLMATMQPNGSLSLAIQSGVAIGVIHTITSLIVSPQIYGKSFHLHPVLVLVILIIAEHFFGIWGLVLGVPVAVYLIQITLRGHATIDSAES